MSDPLIFTIGIGVALFLLFIVPIILIIAHEGD